MVGLRAKRGSQEKTDKDGKFSDFAQNKLSKTILCILIAIFLEFYNDEYNVEKEENNTLYIYYFI